MDKARMTIAVDPDVRKLIGKYAGKRSIGHFLGELVKRYSNEDTFGPEMIRRRLDRIERHIINLLELREEINEAR